MRAGRGAKLQLKMCNCANKVAFGHLRNGGGNGKNQSK